jgi:hypothetical protein
VANSHSLSLARSSSQYAYITDANISGALKTAKSAITIELWASFSSWPSTSDKYLLCGKFLGGFNDGWEFYLYSSGGLKLSFQYGRGTGSTIEQVSVPNMYSTSAWLHFAVTNEVNGSNRDTKFYINNIKIGATQTDADNSDINTNSEAFTIGCESDDLGDECFDGKIDEVRIWDVARTQNQIRRDRFNELNGDESGLIGYWKLNNTADDETSDENDLTLGGSPSYSTTHAPDTIQTYSLDLESGSSQHCLMTDASELALNFDSTDPFTISAWVKPESIGTNYVFSRSTGTTGYYCYYTSSALWFKWYSGNALQATTYSCTLSTASWQQIAFATWVTSGTRYVRFYKGGAPLGTDSDDDDSIDSSTADSYLGSSDGGGNYLDGKIAQVAIWSTAKDDDFFAAMYDKIHYYGQSGLVSYWQFDGTRFDDDSTYSNDWGLVNSPVFAEDPAPVIDWWTPNPAAAASAAPTPAVFVDVIATPSPATTTSAAVSPTISMGELAITPSPALVYSSALGSGSTHSAAFERSSSQYARRATGSCSGINMTGDRTVMFWAKLQQLPGAGIKYGLAGFWGGTVWTWRNWMAHFHGDGSSVVQFRANLRSGNDQSATDWQVTDYLTLTTWCHFAMALDISEPQSSEWTLYANGIDRGHGTISDAKEISATGAATAGYFFLGNFETVAADKHLDGWLDDVRVYDRCLSGDEVRAYYEKEIQPNITGLQGYWLLNNSWDDETTNSNDLSPQNSPTFSTSVPFSGLSLSFGAITRTPAPAATQAVAPDPDYTSDWIGSAAPAASQAVATTPVPTFGEITRTPAPAASTTVATVPGYTLGELKVTATPAPTLSGFLFPTVTATSGLVVATPAPAPTGAVAIDPDYTSDWIGSAAPAASQAVATTPVPAFGEITRTADPAASAAVATAPGVQLGEITRSPAPAASQATAITPYAKVVQEPAPAVMGANAPEPSYMSDWTTYPQPALSGAGAVDPGLAFGEITRTPAPAASAAAATTPVPAFGEITRSPAPAASPAAAVDPSPSFGEITRSPSPAVSAAAAPEPGYALGELSISPAPAPLGANAPEPGYTSDWITAPAPAASQAVAPEPGYLIGVVARTPAPAVSPAVAPDPDYTSDWIGSAAPAASQAVAVAPGLALGEITRTPAPAVVGSEAVTPLVIAGTVFPQPAVMGAVAITPAVIAAYTVHPAPAAMTASAVDPTAQPGAITRTPGAAASIAVAVSPTYSFGAVTRVPDPASSVAVAPDPGAIVGPYSEFEWDGKIQPYPGIDGRLIFEWDGKVRM